MPGQIAHIHSYGLLRGYRAMLETKLLEELKTILQEDYGIELKPEYLTELANALVSYGELLTRVEFEAISKPEVI